MTEIQIQLYISQIWYVSPLEKIRYYLRDIKNGFFSMFSKNYKPDPEYDETEDEKTREADRLTRIQLEAIKMGLKPPLR